MHLPSASAYEELARPPAASYQNIAGSHRAFAGNHQPTSSGLAHLQQSALPQPEADIAEALLPQGSHPWPSGLSLAGLPPLPPGLAVGHLAQFGDKGLEMAIRMGMGIGMGLGHKAQQQQQVQAQQQPGTWPHHSTSTPKSNPSLPSETNNSRRHPRSQNIVSDILNDDFLTARSPSTPSVTDPVSVSGDVASFTTSRRPSQVDLASPNMTEMGSPEHMARRDPLATQIWKAYANARGRDALPNGQRMENLTWRLMHLTLKKQEEIAMVKEEQQSIASAVAEGERRGRTKGKSRVVGFRQEDSIPEAE